MDDKAPPTVGKGAIIMINSPKSFGGMDIEDITMKETTSDFTSRRSAITRYWKAPLKFKKKGKVADSLHISNIKIPYFKQESMEEKPIDISTLDLTLGVEEDMARHDNDHCILVNTADMAELLRTTLSKEPEISICVAKRISKQNIKTARHMHLPIVLAVLRSSDYEVSHETFKHVDRDLMLSYEALYIHSQSREGFEFVTLTVEQYSSLSCLDACPGALV
ncbi:hypothetical protein CGGC5_v017305 [Colletotrichum fructicola Nara gc5]|uniref:Uncharacterized protein n=2 Tax=Colletotrichum fructicola (strain Nara gc5) TaxID=1213859 RepID=A0A7J6IBM9_COLFN|nr:hypothetical protein CGGC5_v017305 [Colletotrichum fructicola Nara gc5]